MFKLQDGRDHFFQWDLDRQLIVNDESINQVHFCNKTDDCSLVCEVYEQDGARLVNVPNILLQDNWRINVYAYDGSYTKHAAKFDVVARSKPADYIYTETEVKKYEDIEARVASIEENSGNYYTKQEVDAAIDNVEVDLTGYATESYVDEAIPTKLTAFENDLYHPAYNMPKIRLTSDMFEFNETYGLYCYTMPKQEWLNSVDDISFETFSNGENISTIYFNIVYVENMYVVIDIINDSEIMALVNGFDLTFDEDGNTIYNESNNCHIFLMGDPSEYEDIEFVFNQNIPIKQIPKEVLELDECVALAEEALTESKKRECIILHAHHLNYNNSGLRITNYYDASIKQSRSPYDIVRDELSYLKQNQRKNIILLVNIDGGIQIMAYMDTAYFTTDSITFSYIDIDTTTKEIIKRLYTIDATNETFTYSEIRV